MTSPGEHERARQRTLERTLRANLRGEVDFSAAARALTTMDASNYRRVPVGVVSPRDGDDVAAALAVCAEAGVPVVPRGGGTSIAGQATGVGVVLDLTRHMNALVSLDPVSRTAVVQPGLVLDRLRDAARPHGLTFGPDPSTHSRCTLGGMIGNNACGAHSVAWGTTADNVAELSVTAYGGARHRLATGWTGTPPGLRELVAGHLAVLRTGMAGGPADGFSRRISGYGDLDALLPERGVQAARAFCGSEGTLGVVTEAVVRLVEAPRAPVLAVLGYTDESAAADAAAALVSGGGPPSGLLTVEGMAADLVGPAAGGLPRGGAWLFVETWDEAAGRALLRGADALDSLLVTDPAGQRALWRIREDAAGTATRMPGGTSRTESGGGSMAWPGWEDCAVPPARLGAYLREFRALLAEHGLRGSPYGHFGEGCVHVRIDFDLMTPPGVARFRTFSSALADLVVAHGGSLSGEHGDGQARAELLPRMYAPSVISLFEAYKAVWDPAGGMNPAILVHPARLDENLRFAVLGGSGPGPVGGLAEGVAGCVGVAKCRSLDTGGPGVMCPSYRATGEERHSTRGRARLLHEMLAGEIVTDGWRSAEVAEALDLCLGCKGCLSDCPVGVDMASYKAEFLHHHWSGRLRPLSHYLLGGLPAWLRTISALRLTAPANLAARFLRIPGLERSRPLPALARTPFSRGLENPAPPAFEERGPGRSPRGSGAQPRGTAEGRVGDSRPQGPPAPAPAPRSGTVVTLWPDTFTQYLAPEAGHAAVQVLRAAGLEARLPGRPVCCGLTYISTGRLDRARKVLRRTLDAMDAMGDPQGPVLVLEPSCAAALRTDLPALLPEDPRAHRLAAAVRTFAETLEEYAPHWQPPRLDRPVAGQTHCHQHAVLGDGPDRRLRERAGLTGELTGGCCGLAGNFGFEPGHHEVSVACAEEQLLPSLRSAPPGAEVLADGFSCRTQIAQLAGGRARHLAEVLAEALEEAEPEVSRGRPRRM
ncbi:FAD-binding oxidoreductase [Streptomyces sp. NBC_00503]|nr:FAD-binding and (Fe-S)-binding domain-containing protein [Streptomyces sp. NBC_00503]WUD82031.1 FAD-binding oxidoreductase [Streptomyces sp. NBC_00503]